MKPVFSLASDDPDTAPSPATDVLTRMELLDTLNRTSSANSSLPASNVEDSSAAKPNSVSLVLDDFLPILQRFSKSLGKLHYEAANEIIVSFRGKRKRQKPGIADFICQILVSVCLSLSGLEQHYYSFNFVRVRSHVRKDADLLSLYEQTRTKVCDIPVGPGSYSSLPCSVEIRNLLIDFINARITLIRVYDTLIALESWDREERILQLISDLSYHKESLRNQLQHCYLSDIVGLISSEICILCLLLNIQLLIISGQYYSSLLSLKSANERIKIWFNSVDYGKLRTRSSSFLRLGISKTPSIYLCGFIDQIYSVLFAKFSLYYYYSISPYCSRTEFEQALNDIGQPNFFQLFSTFYRKLDVLYITFLSSAPNFGNSRNDAKEEGSKLASPNCDESRRFKVLYWLGGERKQLLRLLPAAVNIIVKKNISKNEVLAVHDGSAIHSYLISLVEANVYMVIITNKNIKGNDGKHVNFMLDVCRTLTFTKLCQSSTGQ